MKTRLARKALPPDERDAQLRAAEERRSKDDGKLERMMLYGQSPRCRWRMLLDYFAEEGLDPAFRCGTCDNCVTPLEAQLGIPGP